MASFNSFVSSLSGDPKVPPASASHATKPTQSVAAPEDASGFAKQVKSDQRDAIASTIAGTKRGLADSDPAKVVKVAKLSNKPEPTRPSPPNPSNSSTARSEASPAGALGQPKATARLGNGAALNALGKTPTSDSRTAAPASAPSKPVRGFAATLAKAQAATVAAKAAGPGSIKHKAVEKLTKRDRERMRQELLERQGAKGEKQGREVRSRSGTPLESGNANGKKPAKSDYQGTMKKAAAPLSYKGTMRSEASGASRATHNNRFAQNRYGNNVDGDNEDDGEDYSDIDDSEVYGSEGSSDMEGGFDDMEQEESNALRLAQQEDREALQEEERHKREKLERKKKLLALSKAAAAKKKY